MPSSKVLFAITGDMIDELEELGDYDFQIRLLNTDQTSRGTLPPVIAGITIKKPLCEEAAVNATYVNDRNAYVMRANNNVSTFALTDSDALFDEDGSYNRTNWYGGDIITDTRLNKIEEALYEINDDIPTDYATEEFVQDIDRNTRDYIIDNYATMLYVNNGIYKAETYTDNAVDSAIQRLDINRYASMDYVTDSINTNNRYIENVILDDYATEEYVDEAIRNVEGGNVDLTGYATEAYVNEAISNIEIPEGGNDLDIMIIGNEDGSRYYFTGLEFTDEDYNSRACKNVLLKNVVIDSVDGFRASYDNELVYIMLRSHEDMGVYKREFYIYSPRGRVFVFYLTENDLLNYDNEASYSYATYDAINNINAQIGDIESLLGGI
jgi:hypothetical protein